MKTGSSPIFGTCLKPWIGNCFKTDLVQNGDMPLTSFNTLRHVNASKYKILKVYLTTKET